MQLVVGDIYRLRNQTHSGVRLQCAGCSRYLRAGDTSTCASCKTVYVEVTQGTYRVVKA